MGALNWEDEELIARSASAGILDARSKIDGGQNSDPFVRIWPPSPNGSIAGNSLGFLRYLTRDPAAALRIELPLCYSVTLDRAVAAPNAVIGIAFNKPASNRSAWAFMFPGDTIHIPGGASRMWIWNADGLDQIGGGLPASDARPLGYCGFLVGLRPSAGPPVQTAPLPAARLIHVASSAVTSVQYFGRGALRRILVRAIAQAANGTFTFSRFSVAATLQSFIRAQTVASAFESETIDNLSQAAPYYNDHPTHLLSSPAATGAIAQGTLTLSPAMIQGVGFELLSQWTGAPIDRFLLQIEGAD